MKHLGAFPANRVNLDKDPKVFHLPTWKSQDDPTRIKALREVAMKAGRDPRLCTLVIEILRAAQVPPRHYQQQAQALLKWTQKNIYYANEAGERLQDPIYTLKVRYGDCDDMAMLLAAMYESLRLPWRFVLSGQDAKGRMVRWTEGQPRKRAKWAHIYLVVGDRPYTPKKWSYAEPTLDVNLGWDVVGARQRGERIPLPELGDAGIDENTGLTIISDNRPLFEEIVVNIREELDPRRVIPLVVVGVVTGLMAEGLRRAVTKKRG